MGDIRKVRILIDLSGDLRRLCKVSFSRKDASIYIIPYAPSGKFYFGLRSVPGKEFTDTFNLDEGSSSEFAPKLSIHESGQVHVIAGSKRIGPLQIPPLPELEGQHIASISADEFTALSKFEDTPSSSGAERDYVIPFDPRVNSGRLVLYVAGDRAAFEVPNCRIIFTLTRPTLTRPLFIGIKPIAQKIMGEPEGRGIMVITGWDPTSKYQSGTDYLYIRGV